MDLGTALVFDLFITVFLYLGIPLLICGNSSKPLTLKRIKKTVIINAICCWLFFRILNPSSTGAAAFLWSGIAYAILLKKCPKEEHEEQQQEKVTEDVEQVTEQTENNEINYKFDKVTSCIVWGAAILLVALIVICVICG